ncbi:hypothetical protein MKW92_014796, partial [Papaver armeniacum]
MNLMLKVLQVHVICVIGMRGLGKVNYFTGKGCCYSSSENVLIKFQQPFDR